MSAESQSSQLSYSNLLSDERAKLESKESQIATLLLTELGVKSDAYWIATQDSRHRTIRLMAPGEIPRMVYEISEIELAEISANDLLLALKHSIRRT